VIKKNSPFFSRKICQTQLISDAQIHPFVVLTLLVGDGKGIQDEKGIQDGKGIQPVKILHQQSS